MGSLLIWVSCGYNTDYMHMEYMLSGTGWNIFTMELFQANGPLSMSDGSLAILSAR
jgi:hypothetical protein